MSCEAPQRVTPDIAAVAGLTLQGLGLSHFASACAAEASTEGRPTAAHARHSPLQFALEQDSDGALCPRAHSC